MAEIINRLPPATLPQVFRSYIPIIGLTYFYVDGIDFLHTIGYKERARVF